MGYHTFVFFLVYFSCFQTIFAIFICFFFLLVKQFVLCNLFLKRWHCFVRYPSALSVNVFLFSYKKITENIRNQHNRLKMAKKVFRPVFRCMLHAKGGLNTQHLFWRVKNQFALISTCRCQLFCCMTRQQVTKESSIYVLTQICYFNNTPSSIFERLFSGDFYSFYIFFLLLVIIFQNNFGSKYYLPYQSSHVYQIVLLLGIAS